MGNVLFEISYLYPLIDFALMSVSCASLHCLSSSWDMIKTMSALITISLVHAPVPKNKLIENELTQGFV